MEDFKDIFRYTIYKETCVLVNKLDDVIKEINVFIEKKIKPYIIDNGYSKLIFDSVELRYEDDEFKWRIHLQDELLDESMIYFDEKFIEEDKEFLKLLENEYEIYMFPKVLYCKALTIFTKVVSDYINTKEFQDKLELFGILTIDHNETNNVIY